MAYPNRPTHIFSLETPSPSLFPAAHNFTGGLNDGGKCPFGICWALTVLASLLLSWLQQTIHRSCLLKGKVIRLAFFGRDKVGILKDCFYQLEKLAVKVQKILL